MLSLEFPVLQQPLMSYPTYTNNLVRISSSTSTNTALAELMDHPIEHVIHEINLFAFSEIEEPNESHM